MRHLYFDDRPLDETAVNVSRTGSGEILVLHLLECERGEGCIARQHAMEDRIWGSDRTKEFAQQIGRADHARVVRRESDPFVLVRFVEHAREVNRAVIVSGGHRKVVYTKETKSQ